MRVKELLEGKLERRAAIQDEWDTYVTIQNWARKQAALARAKAEAEKAKQSKTSIPPTTGIERNA